MQRRVDPLPALGRFDGGVHRYPVRIYFEDTDLTGVVYHANYLRYMERARADMLMLVGIDQRAIMTAGQGYFAVADLSIAYRRPAMLSDDLTVVSKLTLIRAAATLISQQVWRGDELLSDATVTAAWLASNGRPQRQPAHWALRFNELRRQAETEN